MPISYSDLNRRQNILQPNLQKNRLVYKGPIPSGLLNLVNDQILMDITRISDRINDLNDEIAKISEMTGNDMNANNHDYYLNEDLKMTIYGQIVEYDQGSQEYLVTQATPYYEADLTFNKFQKNSAIISSLYSKLDLIEAAMKKDS